MQYRRAFTPGATLFLTVVTHDRRPLLQSDDAVETLRAAFRTVRSSRPFVIDAMVVLPDHVHCIWTLPPDDGMAVFEFSVVCGGGDLSARLRTSRADLDGVGRE